MNRPLIFAAAATCAAILAGTAPATSPPPLPPGLEGAALIAGETRADGSRLVALHLDLAPGWKTYWRSPGDTGVPPHFDWSGATNLAQATPHWPRPEIIESDGTSTLGYHDELILPIELAASDAGAVAGRLAVDLGICLNICVPAHIDVALPDPAAAPDPRVAAALALGPDAGNDPVTCTLTDIEDGVRVAASVSAPNAAEGAAALELEAEGVWVSQPELSHDGQRLTATSDFVGPTGKPFALDPAAVRLTLVGPAGAVEYQGCAPA